MRQSIKVLLMGFFVVTTAVALAGCGGGGGGGGASASTTNIVSTATITGTSAPRIVAKSTDGSSCGVDTGAAVSVTFSEDIIATSVTNTTFLIDGASGTVAYNSSTRTATFTPSSALASRSSYTATINAGVKNSAGTALANNYTWSFTTADAPAANIHLLGGAIQGNPLSPNTNTVATIAGLAGSAGPTDGTGTAAKFNIPSGITTDGTNAYVADSQNHTIRKIVISTGVVTTLTGSAGSSGSIDGTGTAARFFLPYGITTDGTNLYVVDSGNHTIRKIVISTGAVTTLAGSAGTAGSTDGTGAAAKFAGPMGITTDGTNLYVADTSNNTIRKIVIATGAVTTLAGTAPPPCVGPFGCGAPVSCGIGCGFSSPHGITTDGTNLYVADSGWSRISKIVIATGAVTEYFAGMPSNAGSTDGTGTAAKFSNPTGISTDGTNLYVADTNNHTIRKIVISTSVVSTLAGNPGNLGATDGTGTAARFFSPEGITTDGTNLYVVDRHNHTIRKISTLTTAPSAPSGVLVTAGNGQATISWDSIPRAACYNLYCANGTIVTTTTGTVIPSIASPYIYTGLTNGNPYSCIVTAVNPYGEGSPSNPTTITPAENHTLRVGKSSSSTGSGTVTSAPSGIDCGSTCTATVTIGATVTLTATPASGSTFAGWSNACSGTGACDVLMDADKMATAAFMSSVVGGGGGGGGGGTCSSWYTQFNRCNQGNFAGGVVPASCTCPANTTQCGVDNVTAGGPYKVCCCN
jgi:sugar lactone lactonase YvrE